MTNIKPINTKELVKVRFKKLANSSLSIYLDIYNNGIRSYEFLHLYLIPETTPNAKIINRHVLSAANAIKAQRFNSIIECLNIKIFKKFKNILGGFKNYV